MAGSGTVTQSQQLRMSNPEILNTVRQYMPIDYRNRVPVATQNNIAKVVDAMDRWEPDWNTFIFQFINKIGLTLYHTSTFENRFKQFKKPRMTYGTQVEEWRMNLVKAKVYDQNATNVFEPEYPDIRVNYHTQNRRDKYKISVSRELIRNAVHEYNGLAAIAEGIVSQLLASDEWDEYLIMRQLLREYNDRDGFFNVHVDDLSTLPDADKEAAGKAIAAAIREKYLRFPFYNTDWNAEGLPVSGGEAVLIASAAFMAQFPVYVLAGAFNMEQANFMTDTLVVVDEIPIPGAQAILTDRDFFVCTDTLVENRAMENPENLMMQHWLHHWGVYSVSRFVNAVLFSTAPNSSGHTYTQEITDVTVSLAPVNGVVPENVNVGTFNQLNAVVAGVRSDGLPVTQSVLWEIVGDSGKIKSEDTVITQDGILRISATEQNSTLAIRATSLVNKEISGDLVVTIANPATLIEPLQANAKSTKSTK